MLKWLTYTSKAIHGFPMGDPHIRSFPVYLPPDYDAKRSDPYPVVFMLAGFSSRGAKYLAEESVYQIPLTTRWDQAILAGELPPVIIVFPDGTSKLGCSQYVNSPAFGNYMDYIADELVQFIDDNFHTHRNANYRGIAGHSSGGFGALVTGMLRPDAFKYICSSAGDTFYEVSLLPNVNFVVEILEKFDNPKDYIDWFLSQPNPGALGGKHFDTMLTLAMAPCFASNLAKPGILGDLFFDLKTGAIIAEIWQKYLDWDPVRMVEKYQSALRSLKWIHLEAGLQDEHGLQWGHRQLAAKLSQLNIAHQIDEYAGRHSGHHWRFVRRLELMLNKMY